MWFLGFLGVVFAVNARSCSQGYGEKVTRVLGVPIWLVGAIGYVTIGVMGFFTTPFATTALEVLVTLSVLFTILYLIPKARRNKVRCQGCMMVWIYNLFLIVPMALQHADRIIRQRT